MVHETASFPQLYVDGLRLILEEQDLLTQIAKLVLHLVEVELVVRKRVLFVLLDLVNLVHRGVEVLQLLTELLLVVSLLNWIVNIMTRLNSRRTKRLIFTPNRNHSLVAHIILNWKLFF